MKLLDMPRKKKPPNGGRKDKLMIKTENIISTAGLTLFILGACSVDSPGTKMYIAGAMALAGLVMMYIGYRRAGKT